MWNEEDIQKTLTRQHAYTKMLGAALNQTERNHRNQVLRGKLWIDGCEANEPNLLAHRKVTAVVSMGTTSLFKPWYKKHEGIIYHCIDIEDDGNANILQHFDAACHFIHQHIMSGGVVLVHCQAGMSRSATICIAYLIQHHHLSLVAAHAVVKSAREIICPNAGFLRQLQEWERMNTLAL